jgi:tRNA modification GTPase
MAALKDEKPPEIVAVNLHEAKQCLEEVIGIMTNEDVLERIFSNFCIGK